MKEQLKFLGKYYFGSQVAIFLLTIFFYAICFGLEFIHFPELGLGLAKIIDQNLLPIILAAIISLGLWVKFLPKRLKKIEPLHKANHTLIATLTPSLLIYVTWTIAYVLAGGSSITIAYSLAGKLFYLETIGFIPLWISLFFMGLSTIHVIVLVMALNLLVCGLYWYAHKEALLPPKLKLMPLGLLGVIVAICCGFNYHAYINMDILPPSYGFQYSNGFSSIDLAPYEIFKAGKKLPKLNEQPTFTITDKGRGWPILDGAEAAYPVYSAFANACYEGMGKDRAVVTKYVRFTNTIYAYNALLDGKIDIFFGARPSKDQLSRAKSKNVELELVPIAKEAFVFCVNKDNPLNNLTTEQIKDIYSGKITNWLTLNGHNSKIRAFQRPKNSGSQTLLEHIMGDTPIMKPLQQERIGSMGGLTQGIATYNGSEEAIGYTFKAFLYMSGNSEDNKMLAINGIEPSTENIRSGKYPYTTNLYAIILKNNPKESVRPFLQWMLTPQGQRLVKNIGYVSDTVK